MQTQTQLKVRRWYSKRQLGDRSSVSTRTIERWVQAGRFPAGTQFPNRHWYWSDGQIEAHERSLVANKSPATQTEAERLVRGAGGVGDIGGAEVASAP